MYLGVSLGTWMDKCHVVRIPSKTSGNFPQKEGPQDRSAFSVRIWTGSNGVGFFD